MVAREIGSSPGQTTETTAVQVTADQTECRELVLSSKLVTLKEFKG